jgi:ABC-type nitrate/sulfonate/bicarbonate transport system permease component
MSTPTLSLARASDPSRQLLMRALPMASIVLVIAVWQLGSTALANPQVLPGPLATASAAWQLLRNGSLFADIAASLTRVIQGWLIALAIAIPLGGAMGRSEALRRVFGTLIELVRPIPPIAMVPIAILWFGIGWASQLFIVCYGAFFPMVIGIYDAFRNVDKLYEQAAQSLGIQGVALFRRVVVMAALPSVISSMRIGLGLAFVSLVAAELIAASTGLGALIANSRVTFQTDQMLVGMITIGVVGFLLGWIMRRVEAYFLRWR